MLRLNNLVGIGRLALERLIGAHSIALAKANTLAVADVVFRQIR
jgi:hypothetical protein